MEQSKHISNYFLDLQIMFDPLAIWTDFYIDKGLNERIANNCWYIPLVTFYWNLISLNDHNHQFNLINLRKIAKNQISLISQ